ncbi:hypothetical protein BT96DRAFT_332620 [Gymnopus androsaceus JB14]|uniref:Uncharacterized protein n=1 Tax=Gymnopus androsaceus JB14 TaxID=1447944 RepID=A0A6A4H079_9AGAR|nr:hypothetical protein BT96DRAFT_332620 [Gymnopus androsaceus JB14]
MVRFSRVFENLLLMVSTAHSPSQGKRSSSRRDGVTKRTAQPVPTLHHSQHPESSLQYCPIPQWAELHSTQSSLNAGGINSAPYFSRNPQPTHMQSFSPYTNPPSSSFSSYTQFPEPSSYQTTFVPRSVPYHQQMVPPPMPMYTDPQMQSVGQPNNAGYNGMGPVASPNSFIPWQSGMNDPNGAAYDYLYGDPVAGNAATPQMGDRGEFSSNQWPQREQPHYGQDYGSRNLEYYRRG